MDPIPDEAGGNVYVANGSYVKLKDIGAAYQSASTEADAPEEPVEPDDENPDETEEEQPKHHENSSHARRHNARRAARRGGSS
jgi:hypothetical protein